MDPQVPVEQPVQQPAEQPEANIAVPIPPPRKPGGTEAAREAMLWNLVYMAVALAIIGLVFSLLRLWTRRQTDCENTSVSLSSFREMYENGELSEDEYQKIRTKMASKMKKELGVNKPAKSDTAADARNPDTMPMVRPFSPTDSHAPLPSSDSPPLPSSDSGIPPSSDNGYPPPSSDSDRPTT